jgi:hypothetical protein
MRCNGEGVPRPGESPLDVDPEKTGRFRSNSLEKTGRFRSVSSPPAGKRVRVRGSERPDAFSPRPVV